MLFRSVEKGGWSVFYTWFTGGFILNPVVSAPFRGQGAGGWFGWYDKYLGIKPAAAK